MKLFIVAPKKINNDDLLNGKIEVFKDPMLAKFRFCQKVQSSDEEYDLVVKETEDEYMHIADKVLESANKWFDDYLNNKNKKG